MTRAVPLLYDSVASARRAPTSTLFTDWSTAMGRTPRCLTVAASRALLAALTLAVAASLAVAPAAAGIRDMVKSAKDKAGQKAGQKSATDGGCDQVEFDDVVIEITSARLDKFLAGLRASAPIAGEQGKLILRRDEIRGQITALIDKHGPALEEVRQKREEHGSCVHDAIEESRRHRMQEEQAKMMANPASAEKMLKVIARLNDAQIKGDKAAEKKAQQELGEMGITSATPADSLTARQKCGPGPAPHPQGVRLDALEQESTAIDERLREMDMKARKLESEASGMTPEQFAMVRERAERYLVSPTSCFTAGERDALAARKDALKEALGA